MDDKQYQLNELERFRSEQSRKEGYYDTLEEFIIKINDLEDIIMINETDLQNFKVGQMVVVEQNHEVFFCEVVLGPDGNLELKKLKEVRGN